MEAAAEWDCEACTLKNPATACYCTICQAARPGARLQALPPGWERATTPAGLEYFKNHNTRTTHWELPDGAPPPGAPPSGRIPALEHFDADRLRRKIGGRRATIALVASSGAGPTHLLEAEVAELERQYAAGVAAHPYGAEPEPQSGQAIPQGYVVNPLAGALQAPAPGGPAAGRADLLRQLSDEERRRREHADAELARVVHQGWRDEDRARKAEAEADRLRRAGTFIWEFRPARAGQRHQAEGVALAAAAHGTYAGPRWEFQEQSGAWAAYPQATCSILEAALARGERSVNVDETRYVDLKRMQQGRWDTGRLSRAVRRLDLRDPHMLANGGSVEATANADADADWVMYDRHNCRLLTEAYFSHTARVELPAVETTVDLSTMSHEVSGVDRRFEVRGRLNEQTPPLRPLAPERPVEPETLEGRAMRAGVMQRYTFHPQREYRGTEDDIHFRSAEAQFHRTNGGHAVTAVEYIINPPLVAAFEAKKREFVERHGADGMRTILAFHGTTNDVNIESILANNFDISRLAANTGNRGYFGAGIYFSEIAKVSTGYARGHNKLLLCKLLTGREYKIGGSNPTPGAPPGRGSPMMGHPLKAGYDSHVVNDGKEVVIFSADQILPCYVVHW